MAEGILLQKYFDGMNNKEELTPSDLTTWENKLGKLQAKNSLVDIQQNVIKFIEFIITYVSNKSYIEQILISRKSFTKIKEIIKEEWKGSFIKDITKWVFDIIIEENNECWCTKKELLKFYNELIQQIPKTSRIEACNQLSEIYLLKMLDILSSYGDFDLQVNILETMFRLYGKAVLNSRLSDLIPESQELSQTFAHINPDNFDEDCRTFLNKVNQNFQKIFSLVCRLVTLGDVVCNLPMSEVEGVWVDFNLCDKAISWYNSSEEAGWQLVTIFAASVEKAMSGGNESVYIITLHLNSPCISSADESGGALIDVRTVTMVVVKSPVSDKLLKNILPQIFGQAFNPSSKPTKIVAEMDYKPLNIKVKRIFHKSNATKSTLSSAVNSVTPGSPLSKLGVSAASSKELYECMSDEVINVHSIEEDICRNNNPTIKIVSGKCSDRSFDYSKITNSDENYSTALATSAPTFKVSKYSYTSSSDKWKTAEDFVKKKSPLSQVLKSSNKTNIIPVGRVSELNKDIGLNNSSEKENKLKCSRFSFPKNSEDLERIEDVRLKDNTLKINETKVALKTQTKDEKSQDKGKSKANLFDHVDALLSPNEIIDLTLQSNSTDSINSDRTEVPGVTENSKEAEANEKTGITPKLCAIEMRISNYSKHDMDKEDEQGQVITANITQVETNEIIHTKKSKKTLLQLKTIKNGSQKNLLNCLKDTDLLNHSENKNKVDCSPSVIIKVSERVQDVTSKEIVLKVDENEASQKPPSKGKKNEDKNESLDDSLDYADRLFPSNEIIDISHSSISAHSINFERTKPAEVNIEDDKEIRGDKQIEPVQKFGPIQIENLIDVDMDETKNTISTTNIHQVEVDQIDMKLNSSVQDIREETFFQNIEEGKVAANRVSRNRYKLRKEKKETKHSGTKDENINSTKKEKLKLDKTVNSIEVCDDTRQDEAEKVEPENMQVGKITGSSEMNDKVQRRRTPEPKQVNTYQNTNLNESTCGSRTIRRSKRNLEKNESKFVSLTESRKTSKERDHEKKSIESSTTAIKRNTRSSKITIISDRQINIKGEGLVKFIGDKLSTNLNPIDSPTSIQEPDHSNSLVQNIETIDEKLADAQVDRIGEHTEETFTKQSHINQTNEDLQNKNNEFGDYVPELVENIEIIDETLAEAQVDRIGEHTEETLTKQSHINQTNEDLQNKNNEFGDYVPELVENIETIDETLAEPQVDRIGERTEETFTKQFHINQTKEDLQNKSAEFGEYVPELVEDMETIHETLADSQVNRIHIKQTNEDLQNQNDEFGEYEPEQFHLVTKPENESAPLVEYSATESEHDHKKKKLLDLTKETSLKLQTNVITIETSSSKDVDIKEQPETDLTNDENVTNIIPVIPDHDSNSDLQRPFVLALQKETVEMAETDSSFDGDSKNNVDPLADDTSQEEYVPSLPEFRPVIDPEKLFDSIFKQAIEESIPHQARENYYDSSDEISLTQKMQVDSADKRDLNDSFTKLHKKSIRALSDYEDGASSSQKNLSPTYPITNAAIEKELLIVIDKEILPGCNKSQESTPVEYQQSPSTQDISNLIEQEQFQIFEAHKSEGFIVEYSKNNKEEELAEVINNQSIELHDDAFVKSASVQEKYSERTPSENEIMFNQDENVKLVKEVNLEENTARVSLVSTGTSKGKKGSQKKLKNKKYEKENVAQHDRKIIPLAEINEEVNIAPFQLCETETIKPLRRKRRPMRLGEDTIVDRTQIQKDTLNSSLKSTNRPEAKKDTSQERTELGNENMLKQDENIQFIKEINTEGDTANISLASTGTSKDKNGTPKKLTNKNCEEVNFAEPNQNIAPIQLYQEERSKLRAKSLDEPDQCPKKHEDAACSPLNFADMPDKENVTKQYSGKIDLEDENMSEINIEKGVPLAGTSKGKKESKKKLKNEECEKEISLRDQNFKKSAEISIELNKAPIQSEGKETRKSLRMKAKKLHKDVNEQDQNTQVLEERNIEIEPTLVSLKPNVTPEEPTTDTKKASTRIAEPEETDKQNSVQDENIPDSAVQLQQLKRKLITEDVQVEDIVPEKRKAVQFDVKSNSDSTNRTFSTTLSVRKRCRKLYEPGSLPMFNPEDEIRELETVNERREETVQERIEISLDKSIVTKRNPRKVDSSKNFENKMELDKINNHKETSAINDFGSKLFKEPVFEKVVSKTARIHSKKRSNKKDEISSKEIMDQFDSFKKKSKKYAKLNISISTTSSKHKRSFAVGLLDSFREDFGEISSLQTLHSSIKDKNKAKGKKKIENNKKGISFKVNKKSNKKNDKQRNIRTNTPDWVNNIEFSIPKGELKQKDAASQQNTSTVNHVRYSQQDPTTHGGSKLINEEPEEGFVEIGSKNVRRRKGIKRTEDEGNNVKDNGIVVLSNIHLDPWKRSSKIPKIADFQEDIPDLNISDIQMGQERLQKENFDLPLVIAKNKNLIHCQCQALVGKLAPSWTTLGVFNDEIITVQSSDYTGKYLVLFFYPLDFIELPYGNPPTEILNLNQEYEQFRKINVQLVGCSVNSPFAHRMWIRINKQNNNLSELKFPLIADCNHQISKAYKIYSEDLGYTQRGYFVCDPAGIVIRSTAVELHLEISLKEIIEFIRRHQSLLS